MVREVDHPHDSLFRKVFSDAGQAAGLLRTALPTALRESMDWPWVPRFAHLLLDQTNLKPDEVEGGLKGGVARSG